MYTQCPDCRASFRVTAAVLQQAAGRVRCGGCGHAFNALERLSEAAPDDTDDRSNPNAHALPGAFDDLSGTDDIRIEDTGVEWQVVEADDEQPTAADHPQETLDLASEREAAEERYDDNTPLPGELDDDEESSTPELPRRRAEDFLEARSPEFDERQVDLALSEPEEWTDLLAEVGDDGAPEAGAETDRDSTASAGPQPDEETHSDLQALDPDLEPTGEHPALVIDDEAAEDADGEAAEDTSDGPALVADDQPADDAGNGLALVDNDEPAEDPSDEPKTDSAPPAPEDGGHYVPPPTEEEITINRLIDQDLLRLSREQPEPTETGPGNAAPAGPPRHVETIIMEGAFVRTSLEADDAAEAEDAGSRADDAAGDDAADEIIDLRDTYVRTRNGARPARTAAGAARYGAIAGAAALALLLGAQVVHAWRETLATYGVFGQTLGALYEFAGAPITPEWDVNAWQFGGTRGSTDAADRVLTISSTMANASQRPLPYPLLYVALTDRYEEIIASQLLEAGQYLEIRVADGLVAPGGKLQTSVTIAPVSPQAEGFKLNVCYPLSSEQVRCATGAFKNP